MGGFVKRGYSILEVLVALVILSIALPGLVRWVTAGRQAQVGSFRSEQAVALNQRFFDSLARLPRDNRTPSTTSVTYNGVSYTATWNYMAGGKDSSYSSTSTIPGQIYIQLDWNAGKAARTTRMLGVLP